MDRPLRIFISTGEVSGDLQGSRLVKALKERRPDLLFHGLGGQRMAAQGVQLVADTTTLSSIGLVEAIPFIVPTLRIQSKLKTYLKQFRPDLVVLIDYIGFNVKVGRLARALGIPVIYYIAPQEWVWRTFSKDTSSIVGFTDLILAIFPEEARYYRGHGARVEWIGHPLIDIVTTDLSTPAVRECLGTPKSAPAVVIAPASRLQELRYLLPLLFETARRLQEKLPEIHFWLAVSTPSFHEPVARAAQEYGLRHRFIPAGMTYNALAAADLLLTKSGTINLEAALLNLPQVVAYRVDPKTYFVGKLIGFKIPFASPVNLVDMTEVVPEFIQERATPEALLEAALPLLSDPGAIERMQAGYRRVRDSLGDGGAIDRGATAIIESLDKP